MSVSWQMGMNANVNKLTNTPADKVYHSTMYCIWSVNIGITLHWIAKGIPVSLSALYSYAAER